jgi:transposase
MRKSKEESTPILSEAVTKILTQMSRSRSLASSLTIRATIILLSAEGESNQAISKRLNMHHNSIAKWRTRFIASTSVLERLEASDPSNLPAEINRLLSDNPRPGCPAVYTQEQILKIVDLACKLPSDFGYEVSQWSLNLLVQEIIKQGIAEQISAKSVSRFLKGSSVKTS